MEELIELELDWDEKTIQQSENKFRLLFEYAPEFIHILDADGVILETNPAAINKMGYAKDELVGRHISDFFTPASKKIFTERFSILQKNGVNRLEIEIILRDGKVRTVDSLTSAVCDNNGEIFFYVTFQRDVTDHKLAEEAMRKNGEKYRSLIENSPDIISKEDLKGNLLFVNNAFMETLGYLSEEGVKLNRLDLVHPADLEPLKKRMLPLFSGGRVLGVENRLKHINGSYITFSTNFSPLLDAQGTVVAILGISRIIAEQKQVKGTSPNGSNLKKEVKDKKWKNY